MAILTVGAAGAYSFTAAGLTSAIAAAGSGDTVRLLDTGTITLTTALAPTAAITIEGDPALYNGSNKATLPELYTAGSTRAIALWASNISIKNLRFRGFKITSAGNAGGAINGQGYTVGTLQNLYFDDCIYCVQNAVGGTYRDLQGVSIGALLRSCTGPNVAVFRAVQRAGYDYIFDNGSDTTGAYALGAAYQDGSRVNHSVANVSGTGPTFRNISLYRAAGAGGVAFKGTYSYCTATGYGTLGSGTDGGNNFSRDPLFTSPAAGDFTFQAGSSEIESGTAIAGVTTDAIGQSLPVGTGWPRGPIDRVVNTTVASVSVLSPTSIKLTLAALKTSDATWTTAGNFTITGGGGAAAVTVSAASVTDAGMSITLTTSEHTDGGAYSVAWSGLTNVTSGSSAYTGEGAPPSITAARMTSPTTIVLTFSEAVDETSAELAANYTTTPARTVTAVRTSTTTVTLTLDRPAHVVRLDVVGVEDLAGNALA